MKRKKWSVSFFEGDNTDGHVERFDTETAALRYVEKLRAKGVHGRAYVRAADQNLHSTHQIGAG